jgi:tRNA pseudouridine38-40 synthase
VTAVTRLRLDVAYDGGAFSGWATQPDRRTVQGTLEPALATLLRLPDAALTVAGRTDAGVHARGQVCHLDVPTQALADQELGQLAYRLSRLLPADVRVRCVRRAPAGFDARFSALSRRYVYRVCDDPSAADPLLRRMVLWWPRRLEAGAMNEAASSMLGEHEFAAFCKPRAGATTIRTLHEFTWSRDADGLTAQLRADAFCHSLVRSLVGCLLVVGEGKESIDWPARVLAGGVRDPRVPVVPAHGLTLEEVNYPPDEQLARRASTARAVRTLT